MRALILAAAFALALPADAFASTQYFIPPGNSGGNEYVESVPTAGGSSPTNVLPHHGGGGTPSSGTLSPGTRSSLLNDGTPGKQAAAFAEATGPAGPTSTEAGSGHSHGGGHGAATGGGGSGGSGGTGGSSAGAGAVAPAGSSPALSVARSVTGLGGHGGFGLLPLVLIAVLVGYGAIALRRRRHAS